MTGAAETHRITVNRRWHKLPAILCVVASLWGIKVISAYALASFLISRAEEENSVELAQSAEEFFSGSADLDRARGYIFLNVNQPAAAAAEFEKSLKIRPRDYDAWLNLGLAREKTGNLSGAIDAYRQSVRESPFYGLPHWYLGQLYYQSGKKEEGWQEIRTAYQTDPEIILAAIRFAWGETKGDAQATERILELNAPTYKLIFGLFLLNQGDTMDASSYLCNTDELSVNDRQALAAKVFGQKEFRLAFTVETGQCVNRSNRSALAANIKNAGFEANIPVSGNNFDWAISGGKNIQIIRDEAERFEGNNSLKLTFNGDVAETGAQKILKQLVLVEPGTRYRMKFAALARDLITDSYPQLVVSDASAASNGTGALATFDGFSGHEAERWKEYELNFETSDSAEAVWISIERSTCRYPKCPIFGSIWLDNLSLQKIKAVEN